MFLCNFVIWFVYLLSSSMPTCALYRSSIRRSSWSPTGNCRCDSACIERPVPRTLSCLRITTNSAICARSFSVTSPAISPGLWCRSRTLKRCCNRPRCQCHSPLVKCSKVRLTYCLSLFCMLQYIVVFLPLVQSSIQLPWRIMTSIYANLAIWSLWFKHCCKQVSSLKRINEWGMNVINKYEYRLGLWKGIIIGYFVWLATSYLTLYKVGTAYIILQVHLFVITVLKNSWNALYKRSMRSYNLHEFVFAA